MMTLELDLRDIPYVWVDAICVDQRPTKRKATIYQMSNIYERATYILAVPDLHLAYLRIISIKNDDAIEGSNNYSKDMYHLLHQNPHQIKKVEQDFLNDTQVPNEPPELRELLLRFTDHFTNSLMRYGKHHNLYCPVQALDHICETTTTTTETPRHRWQTWIKGRRNNIYGLHKCDEPICPLELYLNDDHSGTEQEEWQVSASQWKSKIIQRGTAMRQSMEFLIDLIKDWASRVWVISEFSIAKRKNNLNYWFIQLAPTYEDSAIFRCMSNEFTFFKFDLGVEYLQDLTMAQYNNTNQHQLRINRLHSSNPVYERFRYTLIRHLNEQTFLEMILGSKASRNEDRFYSILPLSEYADKITAVSHWDIHSMLSVKLKLYEIMNTKDKLILLFWSSNKDAIINGVLPTFATSTLPLDFNLSTYIDDHKLNFDLRDPSSIKLLLDQQTNNKDDEDDNANQYYLRLKPKEYYVITDNRFSDLLTEQVRVLERLDVHHASSLDIVSIPAFQWDALPSVPPENIDIYDSFFFILVGCFAQNKWTILSKHRETYPNGKKGRSMCGNVYSLPFFDIY
ncbi:unnamed protein product [Absidia cylindrospora]